MRGLLVALLVGLAVTACSDDGDGSAAFCEELRRGEDPLALFGAYDPDDPAGTVVTLRAGVERLRLLSGVAPGGEVADAMATLTDAATGIVATIEARTSAGASAATPPVLDEAAITAASTVVTTYAAERCQVSLGGTPLPSTSSTAPAETPFG